MEYCRTWVGPQGASFVPAKIPRWGVIVRNADIEIQTTLRSNRGGQGCVWGLEFGAGCENLSRQPCEERRDMRL